MSQLSFKNNTVNIGSVNFHSNFNTNVPVLSNINTSPNDSNSYDYPLTSLKHLESLSSLRDVNGNNTYLKHCNWSNLYDLNNLTRDFFNVYSNTVSDSGTQMFSTGTQMCSTGYDKIEHDFNKDVHTFLVDYDIVNKNWKTSCSCSHSTTSTNSSDPQSNNENNVTNRSDSQFENNLTTSTAQSVTVENETENFESL